MVGQRRRFEESGQLLKNVYRTQYCDKELSSGSAKPCLILIEECPLTLEALESSGNGGRFGDYSSKKGPLGFQYFMF